VICHSAFGEEREINSALDGKNASTLELSRVS